jgi:hypothetical protein
MTNTEDIVQLAVPNSVTGVLRLTQEKQAGVLPARVPPHYDAVHCVGCDQIRTRYSETCFCFSHVVQ